MRTEPFAEAELSHDDFLGGLVQIRQPKSGYRAGIDPVLLAATVDARAGQSVLELGCGGGVALVCLGARLEGLDLHGVEIQPAYAALARRNLSENGIEGAIWQADLGHLPADLRALSFDHVIANPPYFETGRRSGAADPGREAALAGAAPLDVWVGAAARRLRPGGRATFIQRAERLPELLGAMSARLGALELWPLLPRTGRPPRLILLRGRKGGRAAFRFHAPLVLHRGAAHGDSQKDYAPAVEAALRGGAALHFPA